jgi:S-adenosylmethionine-diacylglycerol 3-amino-3-carboxypropyl transferase
MIKDWIGRRCFSAVHKRNLVYNQCWEDPRLDRKALNLGPDDTVLVITSAGCNALDYALQSPRAVDAVDMNPLQNALLELKKAAIRTIDFDDFFRVFGEGHHADWGALYRERIRPALPAEHRESWDRRQDFFDGSTRRKSFYYRGTSGFFAWMTNGYINRPKGLREAVEAILSADTVDQQAEIFDSRRVSQMLFSKPMRWALRRDTTLAMLGVPRCQRMQIEREYPGGIGQFIQDRIETVFKKLPLKDNYFWRVYLTGRYTRDCCPEYLKPDGFDRLRSGLADRVSTHTETVQSFLSRHVGRVSRFVLLDHMDWLYENHPELLTAEWQSIIDRSAPGARVLWRSAALDVDFVDPLPVTAAGRKVRVGDLLRYHKELAARLHVIDRVHTYGSFYIADVMGSAA